MLGRRKAGVSPRPSATGVGPRKLRTEEDPRTSGAGGRRGPCAAVRSVCPRALSCRPVARVERRHRTDRAGRAVCRRQPHHDDADRRRAGRAADRRGCRAEIPWSTRPTWVRSSSGRFIASSGSTKGGHGSRTGWRSPARPPIRSGLRSALKSVATSRKCWPRWSSAPNLEPVKRAEGGPAAHPPPVATTRSRGSGVRAPGLRLSSRVGFRRRWRCGSGFRPRSGHCRPRTGGLGRGRSGGRRDP